MAAARAEEAWDRTRRAPVQGASTYLPRSTGSGTVYPRCRQPGDDVLFHTSVACMASTPRVEFSLAFRSDLWKRRPPSFNRSGGRPFRRRIFSLWTGRGPVWTTVHTRGKPSTWSSRYGRRTTPSRTPCCGLLRGRNSRNVVGQRSDAVTVATARHPPSGGGGGHRGGGSVRLSAAVHDSSMGIKSFV